VQQVANKVRQLPERITNDMASMARKQSKEVVMEKEHAKAARSVRRPELVETPALIGVAPGTAIGAAGALVGRTSAWLYRIRSRRIVGWWLVALLALSAAALLLPACPAYAQAEALDTCAGGGNVGGPGGAAILNGIKNLALFASALIGGLSVLGLLASGAAIILGSASKDWQRRGASGVGYAFLGIFIALAAGAIYGVINWAICG
jgi:hypothetical protein